MSDPITAELVSLREAAERAVLYAGALGACHRQIGELEGRLAEMEAERDDQTDIIYALRHRLAEFQKLYRGQIASDGSYPAHLFQAGRARG